MLTLARLGLALRAAQEPFVVLVEHLIGELRRDLAHVIDELVGVLDFLGDDVPSDRRRRELHPHLCLADRHAL